MRRQNRQVTDLAEIKVILEEIKVARLGMFDGKQVYVVPLNHGFKMEEDGKIIFYLHCAKVGRKVEILKKNPEVCIELDGRHELMSADAPCNHTNFPAGRCSVERPVRSLKRVVSSLPRARRFLIYLLITKG